MKAIPFLLFSCMANMAMGQPLSVTAQAVLANACGLGCGLAQATAQGGTAPYSYAWSGAGLWYPSNTAVAQYLTDGFYTVVVTDAVGTTASAQVEVPGIPWYWENNRALGYKAGSPAFFNANGVFRYDTFTSVVPYAPSYFRFYDTWSFNGYSNMTALYKLQGIPGQDYAVRISEYISFANATCTEVRTVTIGTPTTLPELGVLEVVPPNCNTATGSVLIGTAGGHTPEGFCLKLKRVNGTEISTLASSSSGTNRFTQLTPGTYRVIVAGFAHDVTYEVPLSQLYAIGYDCMDSVDVVIPGPPGNCGVVNGRVYVDQNLNCAYNTSDVLANAIVEIQPGGLYVSTTNGAFSLGLLPGSYTATQRNPSLASSCGGAAVPFTVGGAAVQVNLPCTSAVPLDLRTAISSGFARPGRELVYSITVNNMTAANSGTRAVHMQFDPRLSYVSASVAPTGVSNNTIDWSRPGLGAFGVEQFQVTFQVPADVSLMGEVLSSTVSVSSAIVDGDLANNTSTTYRTITNAYDPNSKSALTSSGDTVSYDPGQDQWVDYTIQFQNLGTDTAFHVIITDTLPANLDPGSVLIGAASHPFSWEMRRPGVLLMRFLNIRLPHSAANEPASHGFINFRIRPRLPLTPGTQLINRANIFFDFNPAVVTEPSTLTVPQPPVLVGPRVYLGGVFTNATPPMSDALRIQGLLPRTEPYTMLGYQHAGNGGQELALPAALLTVGNDAVVDWVVVELRNTSGQVVASKAALLQRDGDVVGTNGTSPVAFAVASGGSYHITIRHRNHLSVMTSTPRTLTTTTTVVDFTQAATGTYGTNACQNVNGSLALWPGDVNADGRVAYTGPENDRDPVLVAIGGAVPTSVSANVYDRLDVNLDGSVMYTGMSNDRDPILQAIGGSVPTAVRIEQLP